MRKIVMQKMGKIAAVSMMSAIVSISFNGCGFFSSSIGEIRAESCEGEGAVTIREEIKQNGEYVNTMAKGECKVGLKEGLWKYYNANDSSELIQEVTFANGIRNGVTKKYKHRGYSYSYPYGAIEYYNNGEKMGEREKRSSKDDYLYLYDETFYDTLIQFRRFHIYNIGSAIDEHKRAYNEKVSEIERKNSQIERENNEMQWEANKKYEEAKAKAQEIAKQRAESKVKKPTMQEVKKSKNALDTYKAKLQAQEEKELQIELSKIQVSQVTQKQTIEISPYKEPKLDTYEAILTFVKDKKYVIKEEFKDGSQMDISLRQDSDGSNFIGEFEYIGWTGRHNCKIANNTYKGTGCGGLKYKYEDTFWVKTIFKDKLNAILPNK